MIVRAGSGWQTVLADLSLILFMVTAAALSQAQERSLPAQAARPAEGQSGSAASPQGEPLALYRVAPGSPPIAEWLGAQSRDPRQQLTIVAQYRSGQQAQALQQAANLAREAGEAGMSARILVEPGEMGASAGLAFDAPRPSLARSLQGRRGTLDQRNEP